MKGEITSVSGVVTGLNLPILLTAGVMLPLSLASGWIQAVAHLNPLYYVVDAGRQLAAGSLATFQVGVGFAVLVPLTALVLWWSTRVYQEAIS